MLAFVSSLTSLGCGDADWGSMGHDDPAGESVAEAGDAILGGTLTSARPAIGMLALGDGTFRCTATLVDPSYVLTAGHCIFDTTGPFSGYFRVGSSVNAVTAEYPVDYAYGFRRSNGTTSPDPWDFALLHLTTPVPASVLVPIGIGGPPQNGQLVTAFGYGCTDQANPGAGVGYKRYRQYNFQNSGPVLCPGDSGGPHVLGTYDGTGAIWGVTSGGTATTDIVAPVHARGPDGLRAVKVLGGTYLSYSHQFDFALWSRRPGVKAVSGDFNGDGFADVALVGGEGWQGVPVAFGHGSRKGGFDVVNLPMAQFPALAMAARSAVAGDFDGDGDTDIALLGGAGWTTIPLALSQRDGTFVLRNLQTPDIPRWAQAQGAYAVGGDFDGDGDGDIALLGGAGWTTIPVAFSNRNGTFSRTNSAVASFPAHSRASGAMAAVADFDGDGDADIALSGASSFTTIPVAYSNRSGGFTSLSIAVDRFPGWAASTGDNLVAGDFDGDGDGDLAIPISNPVRGIATIGLALSSGGTRRFRPAELPVDGMPSGQFSFAGKADHGGTTDLILVSDVLGDPSSFDGIRVAHMNPFPAQ